MSRINHTDANASIASMEAGLRRWRKSARSTASWKRQLRLAGKIKRMADSLGLTLRGVNKVAQEIEGDKNNDPDPEAAELLKEKNQ